MVFNREREENFKDLRHVLRGGGGRLIQDCPRHYTMCETATDIKKDLASNFFVNLNSDTLINMHANTVYVMCTKFW